MSKVLLTKNNIEAYISKSQSKLYVDKNMILTSGAQDIIRSRGISIIYDTVREAEPEAEAKAEPKAELKEEPKETYSQIATITHRVINILKNQYGITDEGQIKQACNLILTKINKN